MHEVEGVEHHAPRLALGDRVLQRAEAGCAARVQHHDLAVDDRVVAGEGGEGLRDVAVAVGPVEAAAGDELRPFSIGAFGDDGDGAVAVELDLVQPSVALRRRVDL